MEDGSMLLREEKTKAACRGNKVAVKCDRCWCQKYEHGDIRMSKNKSHYKIKTKRT
jgi:hypothetical protein